MRFIDLTEGPNDPNIFKAVFLAGGPGSGKSYVATALGLPAKGLRVINSDDALEYLMTKNQLDLTMPPEQQAERDVVRQRAKQVTKKKQDLYLDGRLGIIIDGTAKDVNKMAKLKTQLEELGYQTAMLFVHTTLQTALHRNNMRPRRVPSDVVIRAHREVQVNKVELNKLFDKNYYEVNNEQDMNFVDASKFINRFLATPLTATARDWVSKAQLSKTVAQESAASSKVIYRLDKDAPMDDTEVLALGGAGRYSLSTLRYKARKEAQALTKDLEVDHGQAFRKSAHTVKQLANTLNTVVAAHDELNDIRKGGGARSKGIRNEDAQGKPKVYVDMDGVIANFYAGVTAVTGHAEPRDLALQDMEDTMASFAGTDFFFQLPKYDQTDQLIAMVNEMTGGDWYILSSPLKYDREGSAKHKAAWIKAQLKIQPKGMHFTGNKAQFATQSDGTPNILIDDYPEYLKKWTAAGGIGVKYKGHVGNIGDVKATLDQYFGAGIAETIRKVKGGYRLLSKKGKNLGTYPSKSGAEQREREVQYFKHRNESVAVTEEITQSNLDELERYADKLFASLGIDVSFTRHFIDRANDARNKKPISAAELIRLFREEYKRWGRSIAQMGPDAEAVLKDMQTDINIPFVLKWDSKNNELDLVAKTVMRKPNFMSPDPIFAVGSSAITESKTIVAYHGTVDDITQFRPLTHFGTEQSARDRMDYKKNKNGKIYKVQLNIGNPFTIKDFPGIHYDRVYAFELRNKKEISQEEMEAITMLSDPVQLRAALLSKIKQLGYDGFVYKNRYEDKGNISYVILDPSQAKILEVVPVSPAVTVESSVDDKSKVKIKLFTDPAWYGAEVGNYAAQGRVVNIPTDQLVGFEPDKKMQQSSSKANVQRMIASLKSGDKLPPILVRVYKNGYQVLDGHHRFWAYKVLGVKSIPAQIVPAEDIEVIGKATAKENFADGKVTGITDDWFKDGFKTYKIPNKEKYKIADQDGVIQTLEGPVNYKKGYYIMTGPKGEQYPIPPEKFKELKDDQGNGISTPKKIIKMAKLADHDGAVKTSWGETLNYTKDKDYIVRHGSNDFGVVKVDIFKQTYSQINVQENFADGKKPGRKGLAKRMGVDCTQSETELRKIAKSSTGEKQRMAHWCANMKGGKNQ